MRTENMNVILHRAELFRMIEEIVNGMPAGPRRSADAMLFSAAVGSDLNEMSLGGSGPVSEQMVDVRTLQPQISVIGDKVLCCGCALDLTGRAMTLELFRRFLEEPGRFLSREQVLHRVYGLDLSRHSKRFTDSAATNAIKLVSRARTLAHEAFQEASVQGIEWFPYDQTRRGWYLYRINTIDRALLQ